MDITELKRKLERVKKTGWVVSRRKGNTGVGYTLELGNSLIHSTPDGFHYFIK